jgi:hypothetical protein
MAQRTYLSLGLVAAALSVATHERAVADWTVIDLHPAPGTSRAFAATQGWYGRAFGSHAEPSGLERASMWIADTGGWVNLHPTGTEAVASRVTGASYYLQCGVLYDDGPPGQPQPTRASIWSGSAASWVSIHPLGAASSFAAAATYGNRQVGFVKLASLEAADRASLWRGTATSWVDLHPAGATESRALADSGLWQAGWATFDGVQRAGRWRDSAASWVPLHAGRSSALGAYEYWQVGWVASGSHIHASLWSGTADSRVNLHPHDATDSVAYAIVSWQESLSPLGKQVGYVDSPGNPRRAVLWSGSAESMEDLSLLLPGGPGAWGDTEARAIYRRYNVLRIAGFGRNLATGEDHALLWTWVDPCPYGPCWPMDYNFDGGIDGGDVEAFFIAWEAGGGCADVNHDGGVDGADVEHFMFWWETGSCSY